MLLFTVSDLHDKLRPPSIQTRYLVHAVLRFSWTSVLFFLASPRRPFSVTSDRSRQLRGVHWVQERWRSQQHVPVWTRKRDHFPDKWRQTSATQVCFTEVKSLRRGCRLIFIERARVTRNNSNTVHASPFRPSFARARSRYFSFRRKWQANITTAHGKNKAH